MPVEQGGNRPCVWAQYREFRELVDRDTEHDDAREAQYEAQQLGGGRVRFLNEEVVGDGGVCRPERMFPRDFGETREVGSADPEYRLLQRCRNERTDAVGTEEHDCTVNALHGFR